MLFALMGNLCMLTPTIGKGPVVFGIGLSCVAVSITSASFAAVPTSGVCRCKEPVLVRVRGVLIPFLS